MNTKSTMAIRDARLPNDIDFIKKLWTDYLTWGNDKIHMLYGVHPHNPEEAVREDIKNIDKFLPLNTWNNSTSWATSAYDETFKKDLTHKGLTDFGKQVVNKMNQLGMIVDIGEYLYKKL